MSEYKLNPRRDVIPSQASGHISRNTIRSLMLPDYYSRSMDRSFYDGDPAEKWTGRLITDDGQAVQVTLMGIQPKFGEPPHWRISASYDDLNNKGVDLTCTWTTLPMTPDEFALYLPQAEERILQQAALEYKPKPF